MGGSETVASVDGDDITVGRDPDVVLPLPDVDETAVVSSVHMRFLERTAACYAEDLGSSNGTFLNTQRLDGCQRIKTGDELQLGPNGPVLVVRSIEHATASDNLPESTPRRVPVEITPKQLGLAGAAVVLLVLVLVAAWPSGSTDPTIAPEADKEDSIQATSAVSTRDDSETVSAGAEHIIDVLANDGTGSNRQRLVLTSVGSSQLGARVAIGDDRRTIRYSAPADGSGTDRISYGVTDSDSNASGNGTLTVKVLPAERNLDARSEAVTWIGFRYVDEIHADECGWFVSPGAVVTSGRAAFALKQLSEAQPDRSEFELIVYLRGKFMPVDRVVIHSSYDPADPGHRDSLQHDVGILFLTVPVDGIVPCQIIAAPLDLDLLPESLRTIGFQNQTGVTDLFDATKVRKSQSVLRITGSETGTTDSSPILKTGAPYQRGMSGAPVFDQDVKVVGVVSQFDGKLVVVPVQPVQEILP
jgi:pSer/pThr/pTyr-binding forkhead associated (FHA) protein